MRTTVVVPTYNERENIDPLIDAILQLPVPDLSLLIVDDSSPDGTGEVVRRRAAAEPRVQLLSRPRKEGLGRAYTAAFTYLLGRHEAASAVPSSNRAAAGDALREPRGPAGSVPPPGERAAGDAPEGPTTMGHPYGSAERTLRGPQRTIAEGPHPGTQGVSGASPLPGQDVWGLGVDRRKWEDPVRQDPLPRGWAERKAGPHARQDLPPPDVIVQMDADFSHAPTDLPRLLSAIDTADVVIGSRYVPGGGTKNWDLRRRYLSRGANTYARLLTGVAARDLTGGFNAWRRTMLSAIAPETIRADGYGYLIELKVRASRLGARIAEVPITFVERRVGKSKLSKKVLGEAATVVLRLGLERRKPE